MTRVINALDPDTAARVRAAIGGKPVLREPKAAKPYKPKAMCSQYYVETVRELGTRHVVQLPVYLDQAQIKAVVPPPGMSAEKVKRMVHARRRAYVLLRNGVANDIEHYFPNGVEGLHAIEYVRFSMYAGGPKEMDDDNVVAVMKPVRDALCSVAYHGAAWRQHIDTIGNADGYLKRRGVTWLYRQAKCPGFPRLHGIQLILHCVPSSTM